MCLLSLKGDTEEETIKIRENVWLSVHFKPVDKVKFTIICNLMFYNKTKHSIHGVKK